MEFKKDEIKDLIISSLGLTILSSIFDVSNSLIYLVIYSLSTFARVAAEKLAADKYELNASYSFDYNFFIVSLVVSLLSFGKLVFPILGFVKPQQKEIKRLGKNFQNITIKEKGWISLAGVLSHAVLITLSLMVWSSSPVFFQKMIDINILMLLFSAIPFAKFEGSNILWWNRFLWIAVLVCAMLFSFMAVFKVNIIISLIFLLIVFFLIFVLWENVFKW